MMDAILPGQLLGVSQPAATKLPGTALPQQPAAGAAPAFRQFLDESLRTSSGMKFSAHALKRLESRGIALAPSDLAALEQAVSRAAAKGAKDSLLLAPQYAVLVNIPSRTVITAFDQSALNENVVTNIDSAVFIK